MKQGRLLVIIEDFVPLLISLSIYVVLILIFTGNYGFLLNNSINSGNQSDNNQNYEKKVLGSVTSVGGTLNQTTVWTFQESPYELYTTIIIPENLKLTIETYTNER